MRNSIACAAGLLMVLVIAPITMGQADDREGEPRTLDGFFPMKAVGSADAWA